MQIFSFKSHILPISPQIRRSNLHLPDLDIPHPPYYTIKYTPPHRKERRAMDGQRIILGIGILLSAFSFIFLFVSVIVEKLVYKYGKTKTLRAEVVSTYRIERTSYKGTGTHVECGVVFKTEKGKKLSFRISELSYSHYRKGEKGTLKYKAGRLIDFR